MALRRVLRWLWQEHGAPKLDGYVPKLAGVRPRNVTASRDQIDAIVSAARPALRMWILLCADLGLRSGTAVKIGPDDYNKENQTISFTTKKNAHQTLPLTRAIAELVARCDLSCKESFVTQLHRHDRQSKGGPGRPMKNCRVDAANLSREYAKLRKDLGIKRIVLHDLRRTAAVNMLHLTGDITVVQSLLGHRSLQSTVWYLDHDLQAIDRGDLEAIKRPFVAWRKEKIA
jgi:integrase